MEECCTVLCKTFKVSLTQRATEEPLRGYHVPKSIFYKFLGDLWPLSFQKGFYFCCRVLHGTFKGSLKGLTIGVLNFQRVQEALHFQKTPTQLIVKHSAVGFYLEPLMGPPEEQPNRVQEINVCWGFFKGGSLDNEGNLATKKNQKPSSILKSAVGFCVELFSFPYTK